MYKTELHCHSSEVSCCARADAATLARRYKEAGYRTVVLTNHFSSFTYGHLKCSDWQEWITRFVDGYQRLREAAAPDLTVLFGAELRLNNNPNDFLMFGVTEEFLRAHPDIFDMWIEDLHPLALENGISSPRRTPSATIAASLRPTGSTPLRSSTAAQAATTPQTPAMT